MKTITAQKPVAEIMQYLARCQKVHIIGCGTCATLCHTGGKTEVIALKEALVDDEAAYVEKIVDLMERYQKPVVGVSLLTDEKDKTIYMTEKSEYKGVFFTTPERAVRTLSRMYQYDCFANAE